MGMTDPKAERAQPAEELVAITKAYDLVREMTQRVGKFPRDFKFLLGDRILSNVYDVLDLLVEAKYTRNKDLLLDRANLRLEQMRFQVRLAHDEKLLSTHQYEVAGWIGHLKHGDTWGLRRRLLWETAFTRSAPRGAENYGRAERERFMVRNDDLKKWRAGLRATFPLVGGLRRRWAMGALEAHRNVRDVIPLLVEALGLSDEAIAGRAATALADLTAQPGPAQDALCDEAIKNPAGPAAELCLRTGKRPSDHERLCLFLFVTRLLDAYFLEDFEFQNLRLQYDRADAAVREHVMDVVHSGDRRCAGFFGTQSKPIAEWSEAEIKLALESWQRHNDWARLFHACLELPLKYSLAVLPLLRRSNWQPESAHLKSMYRQVLADAGDQAPPAPKNPGATSSLFERWLAEGTTGELAKLDSDSLLKRLKTATPPNGVAIVAALAAKKPVAATAEKAVQESPHWLVRLAGYATGLCRTNLTEDRAQDPNYWITELTSATGLLDFWPGKATPADLEALSAAPAEAWTGKLGSARKVLRTILSHCITTGTFQPKIDEAAETAAEFVPASDVEFEKP